MVLSSCYIPTRWFRLHNCWSGSRYSVGEGFATTASSNTPRTRVVRFRPGDSAGTVALQNLSFLSLPTIPTSNSLPFYADQLQLIFLGLPFSRIAGSCGVLAPEKGNKGAHVLELVSSSCG